MAEGIAGCTPGTCAPDSGGDRSYLRALCESGQQFVTVTGVYKKNVELMFMHGNPSIRYLEDVATASDACDRTIRWSLTYLVDKADDIQTLHSQPEHMPSTVQP